ncbi:hypothetical protein [Ruegeria atlantica]|uniref:hypothetical protein n=1 Tax=Ruegeria atlantica TaxID=81569 RepID=UPI003F68AFEA
MATDGWLTHSQLSGDQRDTNADFDGATTCLICKVYIRRFQPVENAHTRPACQSLGLFFAYF